MKLIDLIVEHLQDIGIKYVAYPIFSNLERGFMEGFDVGDIIFLEPLNYAINDSSYVSVKLYAISRTGTYGTDKTSVMTQSMTIECYNDNTVVVSLYDNHLMKWITSVNIVDPNAFSIIDNIIHSKLMCKQ